jgi:hypothetical protein
MVYYIYGMSSLGKDATTEDWAAAAAARRKSNGSNGINGSAAPSEEYIAKKKSDIQHFRSGEASPADEKRFKSVYALDIEGELDDAKRRGSPTAPIKIPTKRSYSAPFGGRRTGRRVAKRHTKHLKRKSRKTRKTRTKKSKRPRRRATRRR